MLPPATGEGRKGEGLEERRRRRREKCRGQGTIYRAGLCYLCQYKHRAHCRDSDGTSGSLLRLPCWFVMLCRLGRRVGAFVNGCKGERKGWCLREIEERVAGLVGRKEGGVL